MIKKILTPIAVVAVLASAPAMAANLQYNKQVVKDALQLIDQAKYQFPGTMLMNRAENKLRYVLSDVRDLAPSPAKRQLKSALDDAIEALNNNYMPKFRKLNIAETEATQALKLINRLQRQDDSAQEDLTEVIHMVNKAHTAVHDDNMNRAVRLLMNAIDELNDHRGDHNLVSAIREARQTIRVLEDRYARLPEKKRTMNQARQEMIQLIRSSRTFQDGAGGNEVERFGRTGVFAKRYFSTEIVYVGVHSGSYSKLLLTAKDGDIRIQNIQIEFGNGNVQTVYGGFVSEGETMRVELNGRNDRQIRRIKITATSQRGRYNDAGFLVLKGK